MMKKEGASIDLTEQLKKVQITDRPLKEEKKKKKKSAMGKKKKAVEYLIMNQPFIHYKWRDERKNTMLTMEVLMNGPLNLKNCVVELLENNDGTQTINVRYVVPSSWMSEDYYTRTNEVNSWNGSRRFEARCEAVRSMEDSFGIGRTAQLTYEQKFDLPFRCDNPDKDPVYENTGFWFQQWCVLSRTPRTTIRSHQNFVDANVDGMVDTLVIQLVAEAKFQATKKQQRTPVKQLMLGAFEDDDYPPQPATNVVNTAGGSNNDMNLRVANSDEARQINSSNFTYSHQQQDSRSTSSRNQRRRTGSRSTSVRSRTRTSTSRLISPRASQGGVLGGKQDADEERAGTSFETAGEDDDETMNTEGISFGDL